MLKRGWFRWFGSALILGGAAFLIWYGWMLHQRTAAQRRARESLTRATVTHTAAPVAPLHRGDVIGELDIPRLKVSVMVLEGDDPEILDQGAGHIPKTSLPPSHGNVGIAAHRDTYFHALRSIQTNDVIAFRTPAGTSHYAVTETKIVQPSDVGVLRQAPGRDLTLVTCFPFHYVGSAPKRFIVHARKIG